ncbi:hypothetical protein ACHAC9_04060 [Massilia sp. CMS3.1]|uniref:hypothetical protein n=1 Tax=Massilia sp. CMS3.1 TaxID=3373083 RepID=UPI003EE5CA3A
MPPLHPILHRHWLPCAFIGALLLALLWGALAPLRTPSQERSFTFPAPGRAQAAGPLPGRALALPREIRLTLGVQDVLLLRNLDRQAHVFGPLHLLPGQEFRLPFEEAGAYAYACPDVAGGSLTVRVVRLPDPGWDRLRWRLTAFAQALRTLPLVAPQS